MKGLIMAKTKKELADLALRLWDNMDQADQAPSMIDLFCHLDKAYLKQLIGEFKDCVQQNIDLGHYNLLFSSEEELNQMLEEARKVLGETDEL